MSETNFLGIPIEGHIQYGTEQKEQRPREEFEPLIRAVLDDPYIKEFGWYQYTPYFNDGEPCIFGTHNFWVLTQDDEKPEDWQPWDEEFSIGSYSGHPSLGKMTGNWCTPDSERQYEGEHESSFRVALALASAVEGGYFDHVLLGLFGDHAEITVKRTGITVDEYSHD